MKITIDRIEKRFVVVETENKDILDVDIRLLPHDIQEGDIVEITVNKEEKEEKRKKMTELMNDLWLD